MNLSTPLPQTYSKLPHFYPYKITDVNKLYSSMLRMKTEFCELVEVYAREADHAQFLVSFGFISVCT